jgi:type VI protein secretion system component VasF
MTNGSKKRNLRRRYGLRYALRSTNPVWFYVLAAVVLAVNVYIGYRTGLWTKWDVTRATWEWLTK